MNRRRKQTSNLGGTVGRKTSIDQLKKLSYQEALALLPSASSLPRDIYGLDGERKILPEAVTQQFLALADKRAEILCGVQGVELILMISLLEGKVSLRGINPKGRFVYVANDSSRPTTIESVARAYHVHVLEILRK